MNKLYEKDGEWFFWDDIFGYRPFMSEYAAELA